MLIEPILYWLLCQASATKNKLRDLKINVLRWHHSPANGQNLILHLPQEHFSTVNNYWGFRGTSAIYQFKVFFIKSARLAEGQQRMLWWIEMLLPVLDAEKGHGMHKRSSLIKKIENSISFLSLSLSLSLSLIPLSPFSNRWHCSKGQVYSLKKVFKGCYGDLVQRKVFHLLKCCLLWKKYKFFFSHEAEVGYSHLKDKRSKTVLERPFVCSRMYLTSSIESHWPAASHLSHIYSELPKLPAQKCKIVSLLLATLNYAFNVNLQQC